MISGPPSVSSSQVFRVINDKYEEIFLSNGKLSIIILLSINEFVSLEITNQPTNTFDYLGTDISTSSTASIYIGSNNSDQKKRTLMLIGSVADDHILICDAPL